MLQAQQWHVLFRYKDGISFKGFFFFFFFILLSLFFYFIIFTERTLTLLIILNDYLHLHLYCTAHTYTINFLQANRTNTYTTYNTNIILTFIFTLHFSYLHNNSRVRRLLDISFALGDIANVC